MAHKNEASATAITTSLNLNCCVLLLRRPRHYRDLEWQR